MQVLKAPAVPGFNSAWARNWDQRNATNGPPAIIKNLNPSSGTFTWGPFDLFMTNNKGKPKIITLGQPADWMILRAALGGANYGGKANMCPTGPTELANYNQAVQALVARARDVHGETGLVYELWNEIEGPGMLAQAELPAVPPMARSTVPVIRAEDPTATILTPSARDDDTAYFVRDFLSGSDGNGGKGGDWVDGIAFHFYGYNSPWTWKYTCDVYRAFAAQAGYPNLPLYVTESGMLVHVDDTPQVIERRILVFAAVGVKALIFYAVDSNENALNDTQERFNVAAKAVSGKTIVRSFKNRSGTVTVFFADGSSFTSS